jgi:hypothetical protein
MAPKTMTDKVINNNNNLITNRDLIDSCIR